MPAIEDCTDCGLCNALCPVLAVSGDEAVGPRGKSILARKGVASELFFKCALCQACFVKCPLGINVPGEIVKMRSMIRLAKNEAMVENVKRFGNVFGKPGARIKDLQCC